MLPAGPRGGQEQWKGLGVLHFIQQETSWAARVPAGQGSGWRLLHPNSIPCTGGAVVWLLPACVVAQMGNQSSGTSDCRPKPPVFPLSCDAALAGATCPGSCPLPAGIHHL